MDAVRYWLALLVTMAFPPAILYWLVLHPFVAAWRRVGKGVAFAVLLAVYAGTAYAIFESREWLMRGDYGTEPRLWIPAAACYGLAAWIEVRVRRRLTFRTLVGIPELDATGRRGTLLDRGIYARVRHPRYVGALLIVIAVALFTNYLVAYVLIPFSAAGLAAIAWLEERELLERFGEAYAEYRRRVPMFIPRPGSR